MPWSDGSYKIKKVISIGTVSELTGLSERQIRYYEERKLIFPERSKTGIRKYSFQDVETLIEIANQLEEGVLTHEIRKELKRREQLIDPKVVRNSLLQGQLNAHFK
ncbi:MerR family transcriptional regulator [Ureibacillus composti]|uniref:MerR family transcriptional regulator n=1 Tax=Lysinibacillus composti TaxID=720633 RepID=A0A3N9UWI2_9BACI|nr:MerR family transcriptional regulator [Lysinibacillus composti]MBM7607203.1 DNA-binding transcriptional MerR regulator [Lysinibacillus composti]MDM5334393.1 MerR family transcriptional regulator [Ureibacillus composti]RQW76216.1 MerR family transcriptional regulator [Lysinibacillus composti]HWJ79921.1 MerR family transcriptional regulator [Niallia sp.]